MKRKIIGGLLGVTILITGAVSFADTNNQKDIFVELKSNISENIIVAEGFFEVEDFGKAVPLTELKASDIVIVDAVELDKNSIAISAENIEDLLEKINSDSLRLTPIEKSNLSKVVKNSNGLVEEILINGEGVDSLNELKLIKIEKVK